MKKILIIEDDTAIRTALKHDLEFEGYAVKMAEDGVLGFELCHEHGL